jgi:Immunoglobulin domain
MLTCESLTFQFKVLPQIVPFTFGEDEVNFDDSVMASCSIIKGDLPLHVWWRFTESDESMSFNLTTNDGVVISKPSQKISILAIDAVKARHRGNYTCFASNKGGASQFSTYLAVNGLKSVLTITSRFRILQFVSKLSCELLNRFIIENSFKII